MQIIFLARHYVSTTFPGLQSAVAVAADLPAPPRHRPAVLVFRKLLHVALGNADAVKLESWQFPPRHNGKSTAHRQARNLLLSNFALISRRSLKLEILHSQISR